MTVRAEAKAERFGARAAPLALLLASGLAGGGTMVAGKVSTSTGHPALGLVFWQLVISVLALGVVAAVRWKAPPLGRTALTFYAVIALIGTLIPNAASLTAISQLPAGVMASLLSSVPMFALAVAAALPDVFLTAFVARGVQGGMTSGRWALVHAGASGVGTAAIQIMGAIGARIIVTASTGKVEACRQLGADVAVDYSSESFRDAVREATAGAGVDCVLDVIGGEYLNDNIDSVRVGGRIIQVGVMGEGQATFALGKLLPKRAALIGTVLRARPLEEKIALAQRFRAEMLPLFESGAMRPVIDSRYPLDEIAVAHARMESNANVGKIMIDVA